MYECFLYSMYVHDTHLWCPRRLEEGVESPGDGVTGSCESPDKGARNLPPSPSRAVILLTMEPFLQPSPD